MAAIKSGCRAAQAREACMISTSAANNSATGLFDHMVSAFANLGTLVRRFFRFWRDGDKFNGPGAAGSN
jgi:hypothetical protein